MAPQGDLQSSKKPAEASMSDLSANLVREKLLRDKLLARRKAADLNSPECVG